ncbi:uncharacterized protein LOC129899806 [Solanum dulcamara]|uniref:uncharacterized protein LOC129899806 n=1 Tax=Solanum dulcamara TaxID=45834 RepID=UPI002485260D|nr:uncharacterized protein LOC129899806 [Solanum dulcamara]
MYKQHQVGGDEDAILIEVPISFIALEESKDDVLVDEMVPKNMHYLHTYSFEQRRQNWIIKHSSRRDGSTIDYVYHHLETKKKFRSLVEVYRFVVYGQVHEIKKKQNGNEEILQVTPRHKPHIRGNKLIKHYVVGTCTEPCKGVYIKYRGEVNYLSKRDIPSNIEKKRKIENEDLYGYQQVTLGDDATRVNFGDATLSTLLQSLFYLWDFELIHHQERTAEVFPITDTEESVGEEEFIDLLSLIHKASEKRPREEDKKMKKSKKSKHMKRD